MSFATDLLDGFELLYKRTTGILKSTHEMGSFFNKLSAIRKEYLTKYSTLIKTYGQKKLVTNPALDGSVKRAMDSLVSELENVTNHEMAFATRLAEMSNEVQIFVRDKEVKRKKLETEGKKLTSDMKEQLEVLKRAKAKYVQMSKDAETAQGALVKAQSDLQMKSAKLTQISTRSQQANEKARSADTEYKEVLRTTNERQTQFYTKDMPNLLAEFQNFEEERIKYVQETVKKYAQCLLEFPAIWEKTGKAVEQSGAQIDVAADVVAFVNANKTGVSVPPTIEYEPYNNNAVPAPEKPAVITQHAPPPSNSTAADNKAAGASQASQQKEWGLAAADESLSSQEKVAKLAEQLKEIDKALRSEEQQSSALDKLIQFYANDPSGKKKAEEEHQEINALKASQTKVSKQLSALQGDSGAGDAPEPAVKVRGLYDYTATCDTELSFKEGEEFYVSEQDESGWWYATLGDKSGFVPQNYVEVAK